MFIPYSKRGNFCFFNAKLIYDVISARRSPFVLMRSVAALANPFAMFPRENLRPAPEGPNLLMSARRRFSKVSHSVGEARRPPLAAHSLTASG